MLPTLDPVRLRSFAEVAERGTVAAAAAALGYTPPAVSQHLAKLEQDLGAVLFDRAGGRLTLTSAGTSLLPYAHEMIDLADRARSAVTRPARRPRHRIAGFASAISTVVVPRLARLAATMDVEIVEAEDVEAMRDLALGAVDLVLAQEYDGGAAVRDSRFVHVPIRRDELRLVLPAGRPSTTTVADVSAEPWLLNGSGTQCSAAALRLLGERGVTPTVSATISDNATLLRLVAAGHGVAVVPAGALEVATGVVVAEEALGVGRTILAVVRAAVAADVQPLLDVLTAP